MGQPIELSLEQQFNLRAFADQVQQMSHDQAQDFLVDLYKHMLLKEALYKYLLKSELGTGWGS